MRSQRWFDAEVDVQRTHAPQLQDRHVGRELVAQRAFERRDDIYIELAAARGQGGPRNCSANSKNHSSRNGANLAASMSKRSDSRADRSLLKAERVNQVAFTIST